MPNVVTTVATDASPRLTFDIHPPFTIFPDAAPADYLITGLIKAGSCISLSAKAKQGKSSLARYMATCISKGSPFLGRDTQRGEVLIVSIEDGDFHINTCLTALDWNPQTDSAINLVTSVTGTIAEKLQRLRHALQDHPDTKLVIIDTLPKFAKVKDVNSYDDWLELFDPLRQMLKDFPSVSVVFTVHAK
jgi:RecA-family ATPase